MILDGRDSLYLAANEAGALLWPLLVEGASRSALADCLRAEFGIAEETAASDVDAFIAELEARGFLGG